jgi:hypothetical protein
LAKFDIGELVSVKLGKTKHVGRIVKRRGRQYQVFTFGRRQLTCDGRTLKGTKEAFLLLESNLSAGKEAMRSDRQRRAGVFFEEYFRSFGNMTVLREKVHSVQDLAFFMKQARDPAVQFVHYGGHGDSGERAGGRVESTLHLTTEKLRLPLRSEETIERRLASPSLAIRERRELERDLLDYARLRDCFEGLDHKILMFSTCDVGRPGGLAQYVSEISGAKAVIAYCENVYDHQTNAAEALLYWQLIWMQSKKNTPAKIVRHLRETSPKVLAHKLPIVCYVDGEQVVGKKRRRRKPGRSRGG